MKQTKFAKKQNFHSDTGAFPPPVRESTGGKLGLFVCALVGCILLSCKTPPAPAVEKPAETAQAEAAQEAVAAEPVRPPPDLPRYILRAEERLDKLDTPVNPELPEPPFNDIILMADETKEPPLPEPPLPIPPLVETAAAPPPSAPVPPPTPPTPPPAVVQQPPPVPPPAAPPAPVPPPPAPVPPPPAPVRRTPPPPPVNVKPAEIAVVPQRPPEQPAGSTRPAQRPPSETVPAVEPARPSRAARVQVGQMLEIPFRGAGWVYTGEVMQKRGIDFDSRRLDAEGQTFVFRPTAPGGYTLTFSKNDFYNGHEYEDTVAVSVGPAAADTADSRVRLSEIWPPPDYVPPAFGRNAGKAGSAAAAPPASGVAAAPTPDRQAGGQMPAGLAGPPSRPAGDDVPGRGTSSPAGGGAAQPAFNGSDDFDGDFDESGAADMAAAAAGSAYAAGGAHVPLVTAAELTALLDGVEAAYSAGNIPRALENLEQIAPAAVDADDRALYLRGKMYEAPGALRNIKNSLASYTALTKRFPQSQYYDEAAKRIAYLNKFYFNIK